MFSYHNILQVIFEYNFNLMLVEKLNINPFKKQNVQSHG